MHGTGGWRVWAWECTRFRIKRIAFSSNVKIQTTSIFHFVESTASQHTGVLSDTGRCLTDRRDFGISASMHSQFMTQSSVIDFRRMFYSVMMGERFGLITTECTKRDEVSAR